MSTGIYLEDHPPKRRQFKARGTTVSGVIVVHTAEGVMDTVGPDTGAESVAAFIANRTDPGSYHRLVDSDSIVKLVRLSMQAYGDGTGSNPHAMHLSFACKTVDWARMSPAKRDAFLRNGARAAAEMAHYHHSVTGETIPVKRITRAQSDARVPGFISHAERDPTRRSDPGANFPWQRFLQFFAEEMVARGLGPKPAPKPEPTPNITAALQAKTQAARIKALQLVAARSSSSRAVAAAKKWLKAIADAKAARAELVKQERK